MRVLVTGAAGGIGRPMVDALLAAGHEVTAMDRQPFTSPTPATVVGEITDPAVLAACLTDVDRVVHLAAIPAPGMHPDLTVFANNTQGTYALLDAAGRRGIERVVLASSLSALGFAWADRDLSPEYAPVDEDCPSLAQDPYALSKLVDELTATGLHHRYGMTTIALRLPFVGHGDRLTQRHQAVLADPAQAQRELWGWLHTDDATSAILAAVHAAITGSHVINVVAPSTLSDQPTEELMRRWHPNCPLREPIKGTNSAFDTRRAQQMLGFAATHVDPAA